MTTVWGSANESGRGKGGPAGRQAFTNWPLPIGDIKTRHGLTFVYSSEPGGFSPEDLLRLPCDGRRVELLNGVAVVRPALTPSQQQLIRHLYVRLCDTCPKHLTVLDGPCDVWLGPATVFRPDIQVVPRECMREDDTPGNTHAELVVELRPDDTDSDERRAKMHGCRDADIPSYWIIDPKTGRVAVYERKYIKRDSTTYCHDEVCERGQRNGWRLWAGSA
jgi:Uma2 family endonuclease